METNLVCVFTVRATSSFWSSIDLITYSHLTACVMLWLKKSFKNMQQICYQHAFPPNRDPCNHMLHNIEAVRLQRLGKNIEVDIKLRAPDTDKNFPGYSQMVVAYCPITPISTLVSNVKISRIPHSLGHMTKTQVCRKITRASDSFSTIWVSWIT